MARENNAMSDAEIREFMIGIEWAALGVLDADGAPSGEAVPVILEDDWLYFGVAQGSALEMSLSQDPRCCCSAELFPSYYEIKGATIHGAAKLADPQPSVMKALQTRAQMHGLSASIIYTIPLLDDAFGYDFGKLARR